LIIFLYYFLDHYEALKLVLKGGVPGEIYNISTENEYEGI
jgi:dTDP-D-glucose 4,6-dehydratase